MPLSPAYKNILIAPAPIGKLRFASAEVETMYGKVSVAWEKTDNRFSLYITIPCNTEAKVVLPNLGGRLLEKEEPLEMEPDREKGILFAERRKDTYLLQIGSGEYRFAVEK